MRRLLHNPWLQRHARGLKPAYMAARRAVSNPAGLIGGAAARRMLAAPPPLAEIADRACFIFSFARSGTTVFGEMLRSHPACVSMGESLNEATFESFFMYLNGRRFAGIEKNPTNVQKLFYWYVYEAVRGFPGRTVLFDLKIENLHLIDGNWRMPGPRFRIFEVARDAGIRSILIVRENLLERYLSGRIAEHTHRFHSFESGGSAEAGRIRVDVAELGANVAAVLDAYDHVEAVLGPGDRLLKVSFERMFARDGTFRTEVVAGLARFLGVGNGFAAAPRLSKLGDSRHQLVENYAECAEYYREFLAVHRPRSDSRSA